MMPVSRSARKACLSFAAVLFILLLLAVPVTAGLSFPSGNGGMAVTQPVHRIILISLDGTRYDTFQQLLSGRKLPFMAGMIREGGIANLTITDHLTVTAPGHAEMLTGYGPDITGIYDNYNMSSPIPDGLTVWERLDTARGPEDWYNGAIFGKARPRDIFGNAAPEIDYWFDLSMWSNPGDLYPGGSSIEGYVIKNETLRFIDEYSDRDFFLFVHFADPDHNGHAFGEDSHQYKDAIADCDGWIGQILMSLLKHRIYASTTVLVTTDHGFREGQKNHMSNPYPGGDPNCYHTFLISNKQSLDGLSGIQSDTAPTIYSLAGVDDTMFSPDFASTSGAMPLRERGHFP